MNTVNPIIQKWRVIYDDERKKHEYERYREKDYK